LAAVRSARVLGEPWPFPGKLKNEDETKPAKPSAKPQVKKFNPDDYLKLAVKVQDFATSFSIEQAEGAAFAAGLVFDRLERLLAQDPRKNSEAIEYLKPLTRESLKLGLLASRIAARVPGFGAAKFAFGIAVAGNIGKLILASETKGASPSWGQFLKTREKTEPYLRWQSSLLLERDRFGCSYEEVSILALQGFGVFQPFLEPILFQRRPHFLKNTTIESFQMAGVLYLASLLLALGKPMEKGSVAFKEISALSFWKALKIRESVLLEVSKEVAGATL
jgi:hypothetical protein